MSRLEKTKQAYDKLTDLLNQQVRSRNGDVKELDKFREVLDVAFYLLGWSQFEYLVRQEAKEIVDINARSKHIERHAWKHLQEGIKEYSVRKRLELIFDGKQKILNELNKDYTVRNDAAHNYKQLPPC